VCAGRRGGEERRVCQFSWKANESELARTAATGFGGVFFLR